MMRLGGGSQQERGEPEVHERTINASMIRSRGTDGLETTLSISSLSRNTKRQVLIMASILSAERSGCFSM
jgi:hypothetical protein